MEAIELYVKESLDESQGQFWPIIKKVRVGMPASKVCRGGTMLVDLPGSRDSNAARDNVAQKVGFPIYINIKFAIQIYV